MAEALFQLLAVRMFKVGLDVHALGPGTSLQELREFITTNRQARVCKGPQDLKHSTLECEC